MPSKAWRSDATGGVCCGLKDNELSLKALSESADPLRSQRQDRSLYWDRYPKRRAFQGKNLKLK
jgi:hypothetical protein